MVSCIPSAAPAWPAACGRRRGSSSDRDRCYRCGQHKWVRFDGCRSDRSAVAELARGRGPARDACAVAYSKPFGAIGLGGVIANASADAEADGA
jgi:hypothetical protein